MKNKQIIIELLHSNEIEKMYLTSNAEGADKKSSKASVPALPGVKIDAEFGVVQIPKLTKVDPFAADAELENYSPDAEVVDMTLKSSTYIVRAEVEASKLDKTVDDLMAQANVKGVFADVEIQSSLVCAGSAAVGTHLDVERLLCVSKLQEKGMTGKGVYVAIVDTGINMAHLNSHGKTPSLNSAWSWKPASAPAALTPGTAPVGHGTMCAFDVAIAAPKCTLLDIALLSRTGPSGATVMSGFLSDAILAYNHLINFMNRPVVAGDNRSLVVNNSWGMFHPSWDFPVGHPGNFSSNPNHPFNLIVGTLAAKGADILFAAGNCGSECPDGRCQGVTNQGIYGANSHPSVTTVVGIATNMDRVGYSNRGPGRLFTNKPDLTAYTHFAGSGVYAADGGTSAATPVLAGVVAAIRTKRPLTNAVTRRPAAIRSILRSTATDIGTSGFDFTYGYGLVNGCKIVKKLYPFDVIPFCRKFPRICAILKDRNKLIDICKINPRLCERIRKEIPNLPPDIDPDVIKFLKEFDRNRHLSAFDEIEAELTNMAQSGELNSDVNADTEDSPCNCGCKD